MAKAWDEVEAIERSGDVTAVADKLAPNCSIVLSPISSSHDTGPSSETMIPSTVTSFFCDDGEMEGVTSEAEMALLLGGGGSRSSLRLVGIGYSGPYSTGSQLQVWADRCGVSIASLPSSLPSWDNKISSARAMGGCGTMKLYEHAYFGGATISCSTYRSTLGAMNNAASATYIY